MSKKPKEELKDQEDILDEAAEEAVEPVEEADQSAELIADEAAEEPSELELALQRAEDFENKYLRAHAEMQNIQRRANEERQSLQRYRSQDLAKKILPSLDNLERALAVEGLTDDVKKGLEMVQESLVQALKKKVLKRFLWKPLTTICTWQSKPYQQMMTTQQIVSLRFSKKAISFMSAY